MEILFAKSWWEMMKHPAEMFLDRCVEDGYDASELHVPAVPASPAVIQQWHQDRSLKMIGQFVTEGDSIAEHLSSLEKRYYDCVEAGAILVNGHIGRDSFCESDNRVLIERGCELSRETGIELCHETHRGRPTFACHHTCHLLKQHPSMLLTLDISHWVCVHERLLDDLRDSLARVFASTRLVHARIGHAEGPQVSHPFAPEWEKERETHLGWWKEVIQARKAAGDAWFVITPEFGPRNYMPTLPFTHQPVADAWTVNLDMRRWLQQEL